MPFHALCEFIVVIPVASSSIPHSELIVDAFDWIYGWEGIHTQECVYSVTLKDMKYCLRFPGSVICLLLLI